MHFLCFTPVVFFILILCRFTGNLVMNSDFTNTRGCIKDKEEFFFISYLSVLVNGCLGLDLP